jgi:acyl-CoA synthetase (AMP-forming)/AMP-acid ligase II
MSTALPILPDRDSPVARHGERLVPRSVFLGEISAVASLLPPARYVVNLCTDRYRFTVAWLAAMMRGQVTLLPSSRNAHAVSALVPAYPSLYAISDDPGETWPVDVMVYPDAQPVPAEDTGLAFPPDQLAAILFTSGSTGEPSPSPRRWGRLVAAAQAEGRALGVERYPGAELIATVPHAHSYGLESSVVMPLRHGLLLTAERPFFPADVAAALDRAAVPSLLVTTPVHLRALVGDAAGPGFGTSFRAGFVLSATAPLATELAQTAEAAFNAPVYEIFGCSEAGQLATRRTIDGPVWRCLDGFRLYTTETGCWAAGPAEDDVRLADTIEPSEDGTTFVLQGRNADMVNIAGKRSSLGHLTQQLLSIPGVRDGAFAMPDEGVSAAIPRLLAVAHAPGRTAAEILAALRDRIDPAFMPRPLHLVDRLPRNDLGKLPRADLLRLVASREPEPLQIHFPDDHPAGPGHFPGDPIIPGAVLLDEILAVLPSTQSGVLDFAKFHHPVRPGQTIVLSLRNDERFLRFEGRLANTDHVVISGALRLPFPPS